MNGKEVIRLIGYAGFLMNAEDTFADVVRYIVNLVNQHERECLLRVGSLPSALSVLCKQYTWVSAQSAYLDLEAICAQFALEWNIKDGWLIVTERDTGQH